MCSKRVPRVRIPISPPAYTRAREARSIRGLAPHPTRRGGRVVECGGLENRFTRNPGNEGSNPSSSASAKHEVRRLRVWPFRFWYICWHAKRHGFGENASNAGSAIGKDAKHPTTGGRATGQERERETETRGAGASRHWRGRTRQDGKQGAGARGQARPRPHQQALARANASPWRRTRSGTSKSALKCASVSRSSFLPVANIRPDFTNTRRSISGMMSSG